MSEINETEPNQENEDVEGEVTAKDPRLERTVQRMMKQAGKLGADLKSLEGKTLDQQFDFLEFYLDNVPKNKSNKNKSVLPGLNAQITQEPKSYKNLTQDAMGMHWEVPMKDIIKKN